MRKTLKTIFFVPAGCHPAQPEVPRNSAKFMYQTGPSLNYSQFTVFRAFHVVLTFHQLCKCWHFLQSTCHKRCNLQCFFCFAFKSHGICGALCISSLKRIGIYSIFCVFCMVPAKDVKTQKCCNLRHFVSFEKQKFRPKNVNGKFFRF